MRVIPLPTAAPLNESASGHSRTFFGELSRLAAESVGKRQNRSPHHIASVEPATARSGPELRLEQYESILPSREPKGMKRTEMHGRRFGMTFPVGRLGMEGIG